MLKLLSTLRTNLLEMHMMHFETTFFLNVKIFQHYYFLFLEIISPLRCFRRFIHFISPLIYRIPYLCLARTFEKIEDTSSRLAYLFICLFFFFNI